MQRCKSSGRRGEKRCLGFSSGTSIKHQCITSHTSSSQSYFQARQGTAEGLEDPIAKMFWFPIRPYTVHGTPDGTCIQPAKYPYPPNSTSCWPSLDRTRKTPRKPQEPRGVVAELQLLQPCIFEQIQVTIGMLAPTCIASRGGKEKRCSCHLDRD